MLKNTAITGLILCGLYILSVGLFIGISSTAFQIVFEIVTIVSAVYFIFLILALPYDKTTYKTIAIIFVTALVVTSSIAHILSFTTIQLESDGVTMPDYFQIGKMPSFVTAVEYLAWGVFMGMAFLFAALGIEKENRTLKVTLFVCACLCFVGFLGSFINGKLWYIAPMGYGMGTAVICGLLLLTKKQITQTN